MHDQPTPLRKPRADRLRNRERLLDAARSVFATGGAAASLEAVARKAEVGVGTLYRHFPDRQSLFEAVYRHEVQQLVELAERLALTDPPLEALRHWLRANVEFVATKKGMSAALAIAVNAASDLTLHSVERLGQAVDGLRRRAVSAEAIRDDVSAEDILRMTVGLCYMHDRPGWQSHVIRLLDVFIDGLQQRV